MLTIDVTALKDGATHRFHILEFDMEHGRVQAFGAHELGFSRSGGGEPLLESSVTGGCYTSPQAVADVELWNAEEHFLAVFPDRASMREGGRRLAREWGDELPAGIYRTLAGQPRPQETASRFQVLGIQASATDDGTIAFTSTDAWRLLQLAEEMVECGGPKALPR
jgi:hypothetical protein